MSLLLDKVTPDPKFKNLRQGFTPKIITQKCTFERIAVVGLGYVGLPLATHLSNRFENVVGYDLSLERVTALQEGRDATNEIDPETLLASGLQVSVSPTVLHNATFYVVTVPTPITPAHQPDLEPLRTACRAIAPHLSKGNIVVFESTVYPGVTEDICGPLLADLSGLRLGVDFALGYSPERINPGDKTNTIENIVKVVSGQDGPTLKRVVAVYEQIVRAGLFECSSIKVAEGAKVLENTQRDVNIALMNEVSLICDKVGISSKDVIDTAATKWNFQKFEPGLVGGHCIGVDPYYLASLADQVGLHPNVILAGRKINDGMVDHVADQVLRMIIESGTSSATTRIGVFGLSFKEDVPDIRNSKAICLIERLRSYGLDPLVHDPHCSYEDASRADIKLSDGKDMINLDLMVLTCPHKVYRKEKEFLKRVRSHGGIVDVKGSFASHVDAKKRRYWSL